MRIKSVFGGKLKIPTTLFKYKSYESQHFAASLFNGELYIPNPREFNDPFDCKVPLRFDDEELTVDNIQRAAFKMAYNNNPEANEQELKDDMQTIIEWGIWDKNRKDCKTDIDLYNEICGTYRIFCLSTENDNSLMWSYYGDSHRGVCIGYDTKKLVDSNLFQMGGKVQYSKKIPKQSLVAMDPKTIKIDILFTKAAYWKHEKEYRLLHKGPSITPHSIPLETVSDVILGCNFPQEEIGPFVTKVIDTLPHVNICQMKLDPQKFALKAEPIFTKGIRVKKPDIFRDLKPQKF